MCKWQKKTWKKTLPGIIGGTLWWGLEVVQGTSYLFFILYLKLGELILF